MIFFKRNETLRPSDDSPAAAFRQRRELLRRGIVLAGTLSVGVGFSPSGGSSLLDSSRPTSKAGRPNHLRPHWMHRARQRELRLTASGEAKKYS